LGGRGRVGRAPRPEGEGGGDEVERIFIINMIYEQCF